MKKLLFTLLLFTCALIGNAQNSEKSYFADGIEYITISPTESDIHQWTEKHEKICREKIQPLKINFEIYPDLIEEHPCLVYLILTSKSLEEEEKQQWFDLYSLMNKEQIMKLYVILYKEHYKLAELNSK
ncbi:MAG: hypothetical protein J6I60_03805 [Bacteroidaceae bacterium]|nr:hypothetical protein [Bacteroidaceae bacterium]